MIPRASPSHHHVAARVGLLIVDSPASGAWNMAVDEALLECAAAGEGNALRFYGWKQPTLSLGYFQPLDQRRLHPCSGDCPVVRRLSGGGAIVHDAELTYSLALSADQSRSASAQSLYREVHQALVTVLAASGVPAHVARGTGFPALQPQPFLCFHRLAEGDVVLGDAKIAGSAQRRRRGAVLQHGSLLLRRSAAAPELPGIEELVDQPLDHARLVRKWAEQLELRLAISFIPGKPSAECEARAKRLCGEKYERYVWTGRR